MLNCRMSNSIQNIAERLLFGGTLDDKLSSFSVHDVFVDAQKNIEILRQSKQIPSRPRELAFSDKQNQRDHIFPKNFSDERARGIAMHFFANHELLAIELMALCLLRFPHTPIKFQKGLLAIIKEEQQHLQLYLHGAKQLGVEIGTLPVNQFFWNALHNMKNPLEFVVGMGLTFEQANLDHARYYMTEFQNVGDIQSANLLQQVYEDEIRHVRHSIYWFHQWKNTDSIATDSNQIDSSQIDSKQIPKSDFEHHCEILQFPLTPARALGKIFDAEGRRRCGFSEEYIETIRMYRHSKGRVPDVYLFNLGCEFRWMNPTSQHDLPKAIVQRERWWDLMMLPLVRQGDIVLVHKKPSLKILRELERTGFVIPQFVLYSDIDLLKNRQIHKINSWGYDESISQFYDMFALPKPCWDVPYVASKIFSKFVLDDFCKVYPQFSYLQEYSGHITKTYEEVVAALHVYQERGFTTCIAKANIGSAGRGNHILSLPLDRGMTGWITKTLQKQPIIIQPKLNKVADISLQLCIESTDPEKKQNHHKNLGMTRFFTTEKGDYQGHYLGNFSTSFEKGMLRCVYEQQILDKIYKHVIEHLTQQNFSGFAGIDMILYQNQDGVVQLQPIIEINPRYTMGHIARNIQNRIRGTGMLCYKTKEEIQQKQPVYHQGQLIGGILQLTSDAPKIVCIVMDHEGDRR